jgi:hypothetical protein
MDTRPIVRQLADGEGWTLNDYVCRSGPGAAAFEERHESVSISSVIAGSFTYASDNGRALLHSGAILLGNAGACYACGHEHSAGDHCLSLQMCPDYFAEIAASVAGSSAFRFKTGMLPAGIDTLSPMSLLEARSQTRDLLMFEEEVCRDSYPHPVGTPGIADAAFGAGRKAGEPNAPPYGTALRRGTRSRSFGGDCHNEQISLPARVSSGDRHDAVPISPRITLEKSRGAIAHLARSGSPDRL